MSSKIPYKAPEFKETSFNCPLCNAFANQTWLELIRSGNREILPNTIICRCSHCNRYSIWHEEEMVFPDYSGIELPNEDLSDDIKRDYLEATSVVQKSPRAAAALLRLAIQKLCVYLGEKGEDLNTDIGNLVKKGLPAGVQKSLDAVRVIGNESVHPGELDMKDDIETAQALFRLVNFIAEKMITEQKEIDAIYSKIPTTKKDQITQRDGS